MGRVVAIDGPSGSGKSTMAKRLAEELGFDYLDTGALYRAVALGLTEAGLGEDATDEQIASVLKDMDVSFKGGAAMLGGVDVSDRIRTPEAGHYSSVFSARGPVRDFLMPVQKAAADAADIVAEGRDMGTVVFPDAWKKFFIEANVEARAMRRFKQLKKKGQPVSLEEAREDVARRDERDSSRDLAPLRAADDAVKIDNSSMTRDEVIETMLRHIRKDG